MDKPGTVVALCRCGHCKRMTSEYKTLGEMIKGDAKLSSRVVIAKVRASLGTASRCHHDIPATGGWLRHVV